ncbi:MAG: hypothetical protein C4567_15450 [Deltaproteobacteria bacterium]|nr:MAG: hypothetical protein C4567_15450 [Deltaproteobacteria bacterium]
MIKKGKVFLLAVVLLLAFAQVAFPALTAVGPTNPANGFPFWFRSSTGQNVTLSVPPNAVSIPDPVIPGNAFSAQIGFGSEAMYWHSTAIIDPLPTGGGQALLVLALEAAFGGGDAAPNDQIVFARVRVRIDTPVAGTYTVTHPYGTNTFTVDPADVGTRAINFTSDVGIGAPGDFSGALNGQIDPFLVQAGFEANPNFFGDAGTLTTVTGSPTGNNFFRVEGPPGFVAAQTDQFVTGGEKFAGTPFTIGRTTYTKDAVNGAFAEVFVTEPAPITPGVQISARVRPAPGARLTRSGLGFFGRFPFDGVVPDQVVVTGRINGAQNTVLKQTIVDVVTITKAQYSVGTQTLTIAAVSSDSVGPLTLRAFGWPQATQAGQLLNAGGADTVFAGVPIAPASVEVRSSMGGSSTLAVTVLP